MHKIVNTIIVSTKCDPPIINDKIQSVDNNIWNLTPSMLLLSTAKYKVDFNLAVIY